MRRTISSLAILGLVLVLGTTAFAQGKGNGKGGGGGDDGGGDTGGDLLPPGLNIRYRVEYIPVPSTNFFAQDVNELGMVAGWYREPFGDELRDVGFLYDPFAPESSRLLTSDEMFTLGPEWAGVKFAGMNNYGAIVGMATDISGIRNGILVYPDANSQTGWTIEFLPIPENSGTLLEFYARKINDFGDIIGPTFANDGSRGTFVINTGLYNSSDSIPLSWLGGATSYTPQLSNYRKGLFVDKFGELCWFDFLSAINGVDPIVPVPLPSSGIWEVSNAYSGQLSNDGQLAVSEEILVSKKKGGTFAFAPAAIEEGTVLWQGTFGEGYATHVNSKSGDNFVGDIIFEYPVQMQHADWGTVDLNAMLTFSSTEDETRWNANDMSINDFSDRDPYAGFGFITGNLSSTDSRLPFVLIPEIQP